MRTLVPAETLVYLETNDLAAALQPIVDAKPLKEVAKTQPDLSALKGVQLAVAVLGFEATEEKLTDEQSVGSVKPRFVAVADTHAWNSTAIAFAERKLGSFVADIYGSEPKLEKSDKHGGKYFAWTAEDKRKAYALVIDGIVYFANDETAIDKCIAVRRGEADSILKTDKIKPSDPGTLARGYVSTDGIAQIAGVIGMKLASEASDESEIQSAIAGILPKLIRGTITEITWTMTKGEQGIEDKYQIAMPADVANVLSETMAPIGENFVTKDFVGIPSDVASATVYNLKEPLNALRSIILVATKQTDPMTGKLLAEFVSMLFEPYGIKDPQSFLSRLDDRIVTARGGEDNEMCVLYALIKNAPNVYYEGNREVPISAYIEPSIKPEANDGLISLVSEDGDKAAFIGESITVGDTSLVRKARESITSNINFSDTASAFSRSLSGSKSPITTIGRDYDTLQPLVTVFSGNDTFKKTSSLYATETRFSKTGMERRTVSDFGLIGQIIAQLADD